MDKKQKEFCLRLIREFKNTADLKSRNILLELADLAGIDLEFYIQIVDTFSNTEELKLEHAKELRRSWDHMQRMTWVCDSKGDSEELERLKNRFKALRDIFGVKKCDT